MSKREFYKATREDGTDFATGTVKYELGVWTEPIKDLVICDRGYHVADTPAETLVGGTWPCRLFRAEVRGWPGPGSWTSNHPHKGVYGRIRIVEELPAWQALGPNGEAVAALIERARALTPDEARRLGAVWHPAPWDAALSAARDAARDAARYAAWDAASDAVSGAYAAAAYAASAAMALVVRDLISSADFDILTRAWREAGLPL